MFTLLNTNVMSFCQFFRFLTIYPTFVPIPGANFDSPFCHNIGGFDFRCVHIFLVVKQQATFSFSFWCYKVVKCVLMRDNRISLIRVFTLLVLPPFQIIIYNNKSNLKTRSLTNIIWSTDWDFISTKSALSCWRTRWRKISIVSPFFRTSSLWKIFLL